MTARPLAASILLTLAAVSACRGVEGREPSTERVAPLVAAIEERLELGEAVARSKWNSKAPIEDLAREERVILEARSRAPGAGLDPDLVEAFFRAQIEASKTLQRARHEAWTRADHGPFETTADLAGEVRPALDRLAARLLASLAEALPVLRGERGREILDSFVPPPGDADPARREALVVALRPLLAIASPAPAGRERSGSR